MIPRLAPRRSSRRLSLKSSAGSENTSPLMSSELAIKPASKAQIARTVVDSPSKPPSEATNRRPASSQQQEQEQRHPSRSVLPNEIAALNPPLSPSPPRLEPELLEHFESPRSKDIQSERCSINGDFSLTPPVTGPRPLVFSAKRHGHAVRRKHSKRRRRRSENGSLSSEGHTLWKDADAPPSQEATTSDEEEDLSYLLSPQAPPETQQQRFWEFCYGKAPMESSTIPTGDTGLGWSASRKPPAKGWYVAKLMIFVRWGPMHFSNSLFYYVLHPVFRTRKHLQQHQPTNSKHHPHLQMISWTLPARRKQTFKSNLDPLKQQKMTKVVPSPSSPLFHRKTPPSETPSTMKAWL